MWLQKWPEKKDQLWKNLQLRRKDRDIFFLIGNQRDKKKRKSFMVISVISLDPKQKTTSRLDRQKLKKKSIVNFFDEKKVG